MSDDPLPAEVQTTTPINGVYKDPVEGLKAVGEAYDAWSGVLTSSSLQMCYALIGANWVVYGSIAEILKSKWAIASLVLVLIALGVNMTVAFLMTELHRCRYKYAEVKVERWEAEFKAHCRAPQEWPFTKAIERVGFISRLMKIGLPILGALLLMYGAYVKEAPNIHRFFPRHHYSLISS
jgi:hypothetical protein